MTQEQIIGNRAIAVFMGLLSKNPKYPFTKPNGSVNYKEAEYHSSYDWLMPAWKKFESLEISKVDEGFKDNYSRHLMSVSTAIIHYDISVAFDRFVMALNWYNSQQLTPLK